MESSDVALLPYRCERIGDADQSLMPTKWVSNAARGYAAPSHSVPDMQWRKGGPALMPMTGISDFVQQSHNFIVPS
jgi:hypothetical protein